ncbi:ABC transporter permease [Propioniciclava soli]|uniref:ABC transporter permease n=1 Tax=Propioniciclava soli TaxID=2775081 RepID=A0ABZ3C8G4_9ACTN
MNRDAVALGLRRQWRGFRATWARWTAIAVLLTSASATLGALERGAREGQLADGMVVTEIPLTEQQVADVEALGARIVPTPFVNVPGRTAGTDTTVRVLRADQALSRPTLDAGVLPSADDEGMVEKLHARVHGLGVGDTLAVDGRTLRITGIGSLPDYASVTPHVGQSGDPELFALVMVAPDAFEEVAAAHPRAVSWVYGYALEGATHEQVRRLLGEATLDPARATNPYVAVATDAARAAGLPVSYPAVSLFLPADDNPRINGAISDARTTMAVTLVTTVLVLLLVAYVLAEFSRDRIVRDSVVIGTQSAHGTSERALLAHYLVLPLAVTLAGSLLGLLLGRALAPFLGLVTDYYSFPAAPVEPTPLVALLSIVTPVTLVTAVNAVVIRAALGRPTQELLRPQPAGGPGLPVRLDRLPFVSMFRLRQALRTPGSYLLIAAGTFLCILLLVFGLGMRSSMDTYLTRAEDELLFHDFYTLRFPDLAAVPPAGHEAVAVPLRVVGADGLPGESLTVLGVPADNPYFAVDVDALGAQELVISRAAAHKYRLGAGDTLTLHDGELSWAFDVVGVSDYTTSAFGFTTPEHARALVDPAVLLAARSMVGARPGADDDGDGVVPYYNAVFSDRPLDIDPDRLVSHSTREEMLGGVEKFNALLSRIVALVSWSSMLIMVVVLYVLVRLVVARQWYSISLLKALGYSDREVGRLYLDNYLWLVAASVAIAVPASVAIMGEVWRLMTAHLPIGIPFLVTPADVALMAGLALGAYAVVRVATARDTRTVPVTEVLKFRE